MELKLPQSSAPPEREGRRKIMFCEFRTTSMIARSQNHPFPPR
jgi:hypothetical protein